MSILTNHRAYQTNTTAIVPFADFHSEMLPPASPLRAAITGAYRRAEPIVVAALLEQVHSTPATQQAIHNLAHRLVTTVREKRTRASGVDALMHEFSLSSEEGVALMCLAEALLRVPDHQTADRLIADKISKGDWRRHLGESPSLFVNAATWGLLITGKLVGSNSEHGLGSALTRLIAKGGEPLIRKGVDLAMRMLGNQFVTGQTIEEALRNSRHNEARGYRYSYDMLGEAALTAQDAQRYYQSYQEAIHAIGRAANGRGIKDGAGISVKLSALHPRYSRAQHTRVLEELLPSLKNLLMLAKQYQIGLNIDAEEADRLELSLDLMEQLAFDPDLAGFEGIGFVVQAYQKRCPFVIDYLIDLARRSGRKFMVRLVKGAYWDTEIKRAQIDGLIDYPVFTRKAHTDVSYLACAQKLLNATDVIYPQFATHNAYTVSAIYHWAQEKNLTDYEFQCLYGMGETLYDQVVGTEKLNRPCRIYAPVGSHETLLAYLVRRLLENGANSSFVNQIVDEKIPIETLIIDPLTIARDSAGQPHERIPLPVDLYGLPRTNSTGTDLTDENTLHDMDRIFQNLAARVWQAEPLLNTSILSASSVSFTPILNPADHRDIVGQVREATLSEVQQALLAAETFAPEWQAVPASERASILLEAANLLEVHRFELMALAIREAGKSLPNASAEVREAIDFLRYYAIEIQQTPSKEALGVVACISPWNFPLAIFIGQLSAALAAGNVVLAKPAEQTPLIAHRAIQLLHQAGVPRGALQFLPGAGETVGAQLTCAKEVKGMIFTGSTSVAQLINRTLAQRAAQESQEIVLIAETGGQNALIVDSSALPEQVVQDVMASAFDSAGQRCSALRVLCLQTDIADKTLTMLRGAMQELSVGNPERLSTDVGPVIDKEAQQNLHRHIEQLKTRAKDFYQLPLAPQQAQGTFIAPTLLEINSLADLTQEVFGPVLHVLRYQREELPQLVQAINASGFGLTLGVHSRINETIDFIANNAHVGNIYVNRTIVGAVVGVQPFGGEGQSGTGPKAGGPLYLKRLQHQALINLDTTPVIGLEPPQATNHQATLSAFNSLLTWLNNHPSQELNSLINQIEPYQTTSLSHRRLALPGPTGETNTLSFMPRGVILCIAAGTPALLNQLAAVLATGNIPLLTTKTADALPENLPSSVRGLIRIINENELKHLIFQMALVEEPQIASMRTLLAARNGAIVPVVETDAINSVPLWRLVAERALSVNTTAAGGNASLMTL